MVEIIEMLREEHRNIEKLLDVLEQESNVFDRANGQTTRSLTPLLISSRNIPTPAIIQRRTLFTRNSGRWRLSKRRQSLIFGTNIEKVRCDYDVSLRLSTTF